MEGIKETKEALKGVLALAVLMAELFKDGIQAEDAATVFMKLQTDDAFKKCLVEAYNGANLVPSEIKDLSLLEVMELAKVAIDEATKIITALQKPV